MIFILLISIYFFLKGPQWQSFTAFLCYPCPHSVFNVYIYFAMKFFCLFFIWQQNKPTYLHRYVKIMWHNYNMMAFIINSWLEIKFRKQFATSCKKQVSAWQLAIYKMHQYINHLSVTWSCCKGIYGLSSCGIFITWTLFW